MKRQFSQLVCRQISKNDGRIKRLFPCHRQFAVIVGVISCFLFIGLLKVCQAQETESDLTELSLEDLMKVEVVYAASKHEQKLGEAPSSVSIITGDEIRRYGYRTLADILQSVRGFYITNDRNYRYVGVRGFGRPGDYNTRVLLLIDGIRINENVYDMAPIGTDFLLDVNVIDRVEIVRGPSSSLYGTNAFFGVINVVTKRYQDLRGVRISGETASFGAFKGEGSYGHGFPNGVEIFASGSGYDCQGQDLYYAEYDSPITNHGVAEGCDRTRYQNFLVKSVYRGFNILAGFSSREKHVPTGAWGTVFNDPRTRTIDEHAFLAVEHRQVVHPDLALLTRFCVQNYRYNGYYVFDDAEVGDPPELVINLDGGTGQWWGGELMLDWNLSKYHHFTVGTEFRYNSRIDQTNYDEGSNLYYLDDHQDFPIWALFAQEEFRIYDKLILNTGIRYDHYETFGGTGNPRLGLIYSPFRLTNLKLLYGTAFRAPNAYELYYNDGGNSQKSNPDLEPERIQTYEAIWEQRFKKYFRGEVSLYYYTIKDLISLTTDPVDELMVFQNVEEIEARGVEMEFGCRMDNGFSGRISHTLQLAKNRTTGVELTNSPRYIAKLNLTAPILKDQLSVGWETRYLSPRKTIGGHEASDYTISNLTFLFPEVLSGVQLSTSLYNLFDERYGDPGSEEHIQDIISQDGREYRVQLQLALTKN